MFYFSFTVTNSVNSVNLHSPFSPWLSYPLPFVRAWLPLRGSTFSFPTPTFWLKYLRYPINNWILFWILLIFFLILNIWYIKVFILYLCGQSYVMMIIFERLNCKMACYYLINDKYSNFFFNIFKIKKKQKILLKT